MKKSLKIDLMDNMILYRNTYLFLFLCFSTCILNNSCFDKGGKTDYIEEKNIFQQKDSTLTETAQTVLKIDTVISGADTLYRYSVCLEQNEWRVCVHMEYINCYAMNEVGHLQTSPLITDQYIEFYSEDKIVKKRTLDFKRKRIPSNCKNTALLPDVHLSNFSILSNGDYIVCYISGGPQHIDGRNEFFGLSDMRGNWIEYYYGSMYEVIESFGSDEEAKRKLGIAHFSSKGSTRVYPPKEAGEKIGGK